MGSFYCKIEYALCVRADAVVRAKISTKSTSFCLCLIVMPVQLERIFCYKCSFCQIVLFGINLHTRSLNHEMFGPCTFAGNSSNNSVSHRVCVCEIQLYMYRECHKRPLCRFNRSRFSMSITAIVIYAEAMKQEMHSRNTISAAPAWRRVVSTTVLQMHKSQWQLIWSGHQDYPGPYCYYFYYSLHVVPLINANTRVWW